MRRLTPLSIRSYLDITDIWSHDKHVRLKPEKQLVLWSKNHDAVRRFVDLKHKQGDLVVVTSHGLYNQAYVLGATQCKTMPNTTHNAV